MFLNCIFLLPVSADFVPHDSAASGSTSEDDAVAASRAAEDSSPEDRSFDSEDESDESSGGSYSAPSEFRSDVTEAAVMATDADMHLDSASGVLQPGNSTVGLVPTARASRKTPWIGGEVLGKTMYRIEPKIRCVLLLRCCSPFNLFVTMPLITQLLCPA